MVRKTERLVCNGLLSVTDTGDVYRQYGEKKGQLMKQYPTSNKGKYRCVRPSFDGKQQTLYVHRLVAEAFLPNPSGLPQVNHKDGNPSNNRVENLEWVSESENMKHAHRIGLFDSCKHRAPKKNSGDNLLAKKVRALCQKRGVAVAAMEKATGLSNGTLNKWEKGTSPSADKVKRVADFFGVTVDELLSESKAS